MRRIAGLVVHCSATPGSLDIGVDEIRGWHKQQGWEDVGYHYVIRRDGTLETGRREEVVGAHVSGHNADTIGICLVGGVDANNKALAEFNYTRKQMATLEALLTSLTKKYPAAEVRGHRDFPSVKKACPCFDVIEWWGA